MAVQSISSTKEREMGIASLGVWADQDVNLAGAYPWRQIPEPTKTGKSSYILCQEAKVRGKVGDDIRWDVVLEQAAKMPCGLPSVNNIDAFKEVPSDAISTSAGSESTPAELEGPGSPTGTSPVASGSEKEDPVAPWRRQCFFSDTTANVDSGSDNDTPISSIRFPWRRTSQAEAAWSMGPAAASSQRYPASLLLNLRQALQQNGCLAQTDLLPKTIDEEKLAVKNAPWRSTLP